MPKFDNTPYTQLTTPARGDVQGVIKDVSESLPENQTKYATQEDLHQFGSWASKVRSVTASGTVTISNTDPMFVEIDPNGSDRDVNFPAKSDDNHGYYMRHSGSSNTLTLKRSGGATITTLSAGEVKYVMPSTLNDFSTQTGGASTYGNLFPNDGVMLNGKLSVTVASNNLTVAIKTLAGANPSSSDPVYIRINNTVRSLTTSLSVTKNAATNWCNAGSAELATKEIDFTAYIIWNTTPATDILDIGFSRIPYGTVYSDFSGTTTNERYLAYGNASAPTSTDDVVNIGRFAATLSAGAGYTWSVPTFTNTNLIQRPIFETRILTYTAALTWTGGAAPTGGTGLVYSYQVMGNKLYIKGQGYSMTAGTTVTKLVATLPFGALLSAANGGVFLIPAHIGVGLAANLTNANVGFDSANITINCSSVAATAFFWNGFINI